MGSIDDGSSVTDEIPQVAVQVSEDGDGSVGLGLRFADGKTERDLGAVVVAELKQGRLDRFSPFARHMRQRGIRPSGMSKYCVGMLLLGKPVKHNAFKEVLRLLERMRSAA